MSGSICPIGAPGELCLEGQTLARGYLNDPDKTRLSFSSSLADSLPGKKHGDRAYRTGDIVSYKTDGTLSFLGRRDGQIKLRGQRIGVGEIEHHIQHAMAGDPTFHSNTAQLYQRDTQKKSESELAVLLKMDIDHEKSVMGVPCSLLSMAGRAYKSPKVSELQFKLWRLLPEYMIPNTFIAVDYFLTTTLGKLDKAFSQVCINELATRGEQEAKQDEAWSSTEASVREWWSTILEIDLDLIGRDDSFFALGGNSIHAIRLVGLARSKNYHLKYEDIFSCPVLLNMVSRLSSLSDTQRKEQSRYSPEPFQLILKSDLTFVTDHLLPLYNISKDEVEDIYPLYLASSIAHG
ncbi:hypothetical protein FVER14953_21752 [Fusarium verticillioides]|nr:hypothetical protein FVER14953_21752 [Fusarium verticillioides]